LINFNVFFLILTGRCLCVKKLIFVRFDVEGHREDYLKEKTVESTRELE
jgi:hypothetical protein